MFYLVVSAPCTFPSVPNTQQCLWIPSFNGSATPFLIFFNTYLRLSFHSHLLFFPFCNQSSGLGKQVFSLHKTLHIEYSPLHSRWAIYKYSEGDPRRILNCFHSNKFTFLYIIACFFLSLCFRPHSHRTYSTVRPCRAMFTRSGIPCIPDGPIAVNWDTAGGSQYVTRVAVCPRTVFGDTHPRVPSPTQISCLDTSAVSLQLLCPNWDQWPGLHGEACRQCLYIPVRVHTVVHGCTV